MHKGLKQSDYKTMEVRLERMEEALMKALDSAEALRAGARDFGDAEFKRTFGGEVDSYLIGTLREFINSGQQPGSLASLRDILNGDA